jgi:hypothetical protein
LKDDPPNGRLSHSKNLHGYWDQDTVNLLLPPLPETATKEERNAKTEPARRALAHEMATHEPKNWRLPANVELKKYAEAWADEIMPIAREAHDRLFFKDVTPQQPHERVVAVGEADEISAPDHISYADWSSRIVREELHKAGWRLADLLDQALASKAPPKEAKPEATTSP